MRVSIWLPIVCAMAAIPWDLAARRPAALCFVAFVAGCGVARLVEDRMRRRDAGARLWVPPLGAHFAFAFAYPTRRRTVAAWAVVAAMAAVGVAQMQLRRGQLGFLKPVAEDVKGMELLTAYLWRSMALFGTGAVVWYGSRWIHLREVQATMGFDRAAFDRAVKTGDRVAAVNLLTNLFFQPGWESRWREALAVGESMGGTAGAARAGEFARKLGELAARGRVASPLRSLTEEAEETALRAGLWRCVNSLTDD